MVPIVLSFTKQTFEWNSTKTLLSEVNFDMLTKLLLILGTLSTWFNFQDEWGKFDDAL